MSLLRAGIGALFALAATVAPASADSFTLLKGLTDTIASVQTTVASEVQRDLFTIPVDNAQNVIHYEVSQSVIGFAMAAETNSYLHYNGKTLRSGGNGTATQDLSGGDPSAWAATQSLFVTNIGFEAIEPTRVTFQYSASGAPGALATADGLDMWLAIRRWPDASLGYGPPSEYLFQSWLGAGEQEFSFLLTPGYWDVVAQGRILYNSASPSYPDGSASWSYELQVQAVPEPASLVLLSIGVAGLAVRRQQR